MSKRTRLTDEEVRERLARLPNWELRAGKLHREIVFDGFARAFGFMAALAVIAEGRNHHPEWSNVYNRVVLDLATHDAGGVTELDFELALAANQLLG